MSSNPIVRTVFICALWAALAVPFAPAAGEVPASRQQITLSFAPLVQKAGPAVVNIYTKTVTVDRPRGPFGDPFFEQFFGDMFGGFGGRKRVQNTLGSGVILDPDGLIVTNHHVIKEATEIRVVLSDRREFDAEVVVNDPRTDLAVLRVDAGDTPLPAVVMADSDELLVGDLVLAIGNPFGVGQTVTSGIVSALARTTQGIADYSFFIQTDAAINPGNSGGALIAMDGRLVGVNTAIFSNRKGGGGSVGIGFAVPSNMVRTVLEAARNGRVERPWVGARLQSVTSDLAGQFGLDRAGGAVITKLAPDGPFARAGLRVGDIVLGAGGREVNDREALNYRIGTSAVGSQLRVDYRRRGAARTATVAMVAAPRRPAANVTALRARAPLQGATIANMSPAFALETGYDDLIAGVRVMTVPRGSPAARAGFRQGDLLVSINDREITRVGDAKRVLASRPASWVIAIRRNGKVLTGEFER